MMGHMTFAGHDFGEAFYCHAKKPLIPPLAMKELATEGADGARLSLRNATPMEVEALLVLREPKQGQERLRSILDDVAGKLYAEQGELYLPGYEDRYYIASVVGTSTVDEFVTSARLRVTFRILDPFMLGKRKSAAVAEGANSVRRGGNAPASFTFTGNATAGAEYVRIRKGYGADNERVILFKNKVDQSTTFSASDAIFVDMGNRLATVNGTRWPIYIESSFWRLDDTTNVHLTGCSGTIEWRETWL